MKGSCRRSTWCRRRRAKRKPRRGSTGRENETEIGSFPGPPAHAIGAHPGPRGGPLMPRAEMLRVDYSGPRRGSTGIETRAGRASAALIGATPSLSTAARLHHPCRPTRCGRPGKRGELVLPATAAIVAVLIRRGGRVAEGARLESVYTGNRIEGSNPSPSAKY